MITITELLGRAKRAIETGENSLHDAAEDIAAAREQGATQRQIAEAVGKSAARVNRLLKWRQSGYQDDTDQHVQADQSLAVLIEFAKFIADTTVITLAAEDVDEFKVLADRVRSVINQEN